MDQVGRACEDVWHHGALVGRSPVGGIVRLRVQPSWDARSCHVGGAQLRKGGWMPVSTDCGLSVNDAIVDGPRTRPSLQQQGRSPPDRTVRRACSDSWQSRIVTVVAHTIADRRTQRKCSKNGN